MQKVTISEPVFFQVFAAGDGSFQFVNDWFLRDVFFLQ